MASIPLLWLLEGHLKEKSEGHREAPALFKNIGVKLVSRTDDGDGEG